MGVHYEKLTNPKAKTHIAKTREGTNNLMTLDRYIIANIAGFLKGVDFFFDSPKKKKNDEQIRKQSEKGQKQRREKDFARRRTSMEFATLPGRYTVGFHT